MSLNPLSFAYYGTSGRSTNQGDLGKVIAQIRQDSWNGKGPGEYVLPGVRFIHVNGGGRMSLPTLSVNAKAVGYLHGGSDETALMLQDILNRTGNPPSDLTVDGHYGNTAFYIDRISMD